MYLVVVTAPTAYFAGISLSELSWLLLARAQVRYGYKNLAVGCLIWRTYRSHIKFSQKLFVLKFNWRCLGWMRLHKVPFAVNFNWNPDAGQWDCNANPRDANRWNAGNRAFRNSIISPRYYDGEFSYPVLSSTHRAYDQFQRVAHSR